MAPVRYTILLVAIVSFGWPVRTCAQRAGLNADHEVLARLAAAEREIQRLHEKLGQRVQRFPAVSPNASTVQPAAFHSRLFEPTAAFANFEQEDVLVGDEAAVDPAVIDEPYGDEVDALAGAFDQGDQANAGIGLDFYDTPDFLGGLLIQGDNALMKVGGYVKADLIHDLDPIDSQDVFDTTTIPVDAAPRENSRFHARQSRLNFDARWPTDRGIARVFVEGDFFGGSSLEEETDRNRFRLRHAYGEIGSWTFGQTWSTFADVGASPYTLDFEGAVSSVTRRSALVRYKTLIGGIEGLILSLSVEDPRVIVEFPDTIEGSPRTETPDFLIRIRNERGLARYQVAAVFREIGFQKNGQPVVAQGAWGVNISGDARLSDNDRIYSQIVWGDGIGSYKGLPDVAGTAAGSAGSLGIFGWMVGWTHNWTENLWSNFTYSENRIDPSPFQAASDLRENTYLAVNLIAEPVERVFVGAEYLYGTRQNVDGARGDANRFQFSFGFYLP